MLFFSHGAHMRLTPLPLFERVLCYPSSNKQGRCLIAYETKSKSFTNVWETVESCCVFQM